MNAWEEADYVGGFGGITADRYGISAVDFQFESPDQRPPLYHHGGLELAAVERGQSRFELPVGPRWRTADGSVAAAASIFLCDAPLGTAVLSALGPLQASPTAELSVFHLAEPAGDRLFAESHLLALDGELGYSECDITDERGMVVARATTRIAVTSVPAGYEMPAGRPVPDDFVPHHAQPVPEGVEVPYLDLHGIEVVSTRVGDAILRMETQGWHLSASSNLYGGTLGVFAQAAADAAAATAAPSEANVRPLDIKVQYPRPIGPGHVLTADARVVHAGRRICFTEVLIHRDDGKLVTLGTGTHAYEA